METLRTNRFKMATPLVAAINHISGVGFHALRATPAPDQVVLYALSEQECGPVMMLDDGLNTQGAAT
ncbi:hypothetical protein [uncultured Devosia sp.]|uniref:hypothetical protein n=1 Tax=uncultured Devosia sp. TaxID=211434 RepID=UPI00260573EC|nr:hypothetical protein [uncultured Devosia sp.]